MTSLTDTARHLKGQRPRNRANRQPSALPALILMTDDDRLADPVASIRALPRGSAVILRHYRLADREPLARKLARLCRSRGILLLIAGDARLASAVGADGLHMPEGLARLRGRHGWALRRKGWILTVSAHSPSSLFMAARSGADAALLAPVFTTASHPATPALGALRFAAWARLSPVPVYALGGITRANAHRLKHSGAVGIAAIGGLAVDPPLAVDQKPPRV